MSLLRKAAPSLRTPGAALICSSFFYDATMKQFKTYNLAVAFYRQTKGMKLPRHLKEQLCRAASSVALNLAEGVGRSSKADQHRFYQIAFGSLRECQAILDLERDTSKQAEIKLDVLAAHLYRLINPKR